MPLTMYERVKKNKYKIGCKLSFPYASFSGVKMR